MRAFCSSISWWINLFLVRQCRSGDGEDDGKKNPPAQGFISASCNHWKFLKCATDEEKKRYKFIDFSQLSSFSRILNLFSHYFLLLLRTQKREITKNRGKGSCWVEEIVCDDINFSYEHGEQKKGVRRKNRRLWYMEENGCKHGENSILCQLSWKSHLLSHSHFTDTL